MNSISLMWARRCDIGDFDRGISEAKFMIEHCELGVAVSNAVLALKDRADIVLDQRDGLGVAEFLRGPVLGGRQRVHGRRGTSTWAPPAAVSQ